jgi:organic hydroperoxide reductase OsmC/OhrA
MTTVKAHRFPVSVEWRGDRITRVSVPGKRPLEVATPPEFRGTHAELWSPEDLLVGALASCYAVTLVSVAEWRGVPLRGLSVDGLGHVERRDDGRFAFVAIELHAKVETDASTLAAAEDAARYAKDACLVSMALDTPVHLELAVRAAAAA